jgi:hypothetical protein
MNYKELQEDLAHARPAEQSHDFIKALMAGIAPVLHEHVQETIAPLLARIVELEARPQNTSACSRTTAVRTARAAQ